MDAVSRRSALAAGGLGMLTAGALARSAHAQEVPSEEQPYWAMPAALPLTRGNRARLAALNHSHRDAGAIIPCVKLQVLDDGGRVLVERTFHDLPPGRGVHVEFAVPPEPVRAGTPVASAINVQGVARFTPGHHVGSTLMLIDGQSGNPYVTIIPCVVPDPTLEREHVR